MSVKKPERDWADWVIYGYFAFVLLVIGPILAYWILH